MRDRLKFDALLSFNFIMHVRRCFADSHILINTSEDSWNISSALQNVVGPIQIKRFYDAFLTSTHQKPFLQMLGDCFAGQVDGTS